MANTQSMKPTERLLRRAAAEIWDGCYVNLGIGLPSQVLSYIPDDIQPFVHSENGVLGAGQQAPREQMDASLIDAGGAYISTRPGSAFFDSATSFGMVRRGRLDLCMLGAFEIDEQGNLANWKIPGKFIPGIGGAMELAQSAKRIVVLTTHCDKHGQSKIKRACTLPLTAKHCVSRIISEYAVIDVTDEGLRVRELAEGMSAAQLCEITEAELRFDDVLGRF